LRSWKGPAAVAVVVAGALIFDFLSPQVVSVTVGYMCLVLIGYWLPDPRAALALALLATTLIIIGHWISIPENTPEWQSWLNRGESIFSVWLTAVFVWRIRILDLKLYQQIDREKLLMREVSHRAKNILSVVDAIARQTATRDPEHFVDRFSERIQALSANQDLLVRNEWSGVEMEGLVRAQLAHFADLIGSRIAICGPKLRLNVAAAQAIGLALHELCTNAGKYGALSTNRGRVDVSWDAADETFTMGWIEREGPPVSPPQRRGFGTTVMEAMAESSVSGAVDLDYAPSGLVWRLSCRTANALEQSSNSR